MRNSLISLIALLSFGLAALACVQLVKASITNQELVKQNTALTAEKTEYFEGMVKAYSQADKDHAEKVRHQQALASLGYELPSN